MAFIASTMITFFITPYIINSISAEAFGFVGLANNFVTYVSLITLTLNAMCGRFVTINIHKNNMDKANKYFSSSFISNLIIIILLLPPTIIFIFFIDKILEIPTGIIWDVKLLFAFVFSSFFVSVIGSTFTIAIFAKNKLYLGSIRDIMSNIIKIVLTIILFGFLKPSVWYLGITTFIISLLVLITDIFFTKKLLPQITIRKEYFEKNSVKELFSSGIWNSVSRFSQMLLVGFDLLIANIFLGANDMGVLSVSKTVPAFIITFMNIFMGVFAPRFTMLYAKNKQKELINEVEKSAKILNIIGSIPIAILMVFGEEFYSLWVPTQDAKLLYNLTVITLLGLTINVGLSGMPSIFVVTNRVKVNAISLLITGVANIGIVIMLLRTTELRIYAIAGVSVVLGIVRDVTVLPIYGAKCLKTKWYAFYPLIFKSILSVMLVGLVSNCIKSYFEITSWLTLIICISICAILGLIINLALNFNIKEIKKIIKQ
ncbi:oligosaccharide flippase family protein [Clostridium gasigenes]|nr:oligosaccharide flippase family protein [Clostridium gasigenes]QSW21324.1 oligosaccharide flippase family protein [Clostridium gasigenes]